jgi:hypothetical protein
MGIGFFVNAAGADKVFGLKSSAYDSRNVQTTPAVMPAALAGLGVLIAVVKERSSASPKAVASASQYQPISSYRSHPRTAGNELTGFCSRRKHVIGEGISKQLEWCRCRYG